MKKNNMKAISGQVAVFREKTVYEKSFFGKGQASQPLTLRDRVGIATGSTKYSKTGAGSLTGYQRQFRSLLPYQYWQLYKTSPDVRACVDSITRRISTWDWNLKVNVDPKDEAFHSLSNMAEKLRVKLEKPNRSETWQEFLTKIIIDLLVYDGAAVEIARDSSGELKELVAFLGSEFLPVEDEHGQLISYEQHPESYAGGVVSTKPMVTFEPEDLIYFKLFNNTRSSLGLPILETLINECITVLLSSDHAMKAIDANEIPSGLLVLGGIAGAAAERATEDLRNMKGQDHKIRVITSPQPEAIQAKWLEFKHTPKDLQMIEIVEELRRSIWRVFGVMPVELGEMGAVPKAAALVQVDVSTSHLISPILELLQAKFNSQILPELLPADLVGKITFSFDRESKLSPSEKLQVAQRQDLLLKRGVLTINEARKEYGLMPVEGGDVNFVETPLGAIPLTDLQTPINPQNEGPEASEPSEPKEEEKTQIYALLESKIRDIDYGKKENAAEAMASLPEATQKGLKKKGVEHNEEYGSDPKRKLPNVNFLAVSYYRGIGAYITNPTSVRPNVGSAEQWAYGRVNGLLYAMEKLKFKRKPFDTDLLSKDHPLYSQDRAKNKRSVLMGWKGLTLAPKSENWGFTDETAAEILGEYENMDRYAKAFLFVHKNSKGNPYGYRLPIAKMVNGELKIVFRGVAACFSALNGSDKHNSGYYELEGVTEKDKEQLKAIVLELYSMFDETPPEFDEDRAVGDVDPSNFPKMGDDKEVSLKNSNFKVFDPIYAAELKENYPEIWQAGGNIKGNDQYRILKKVLKNYEQRPETEAQEEAIRLREAWSARHFKDGLQFEDPEKAVNLSTIKGLVALIKWFTVGQIGERKMKAVIEEMKKKIDERDSHTDQTCNPDQRCCHPVKESKWSARFRENLNLDQRSRIMTSDLFPSEWQPESKFKKFRTIDLQGLSSNVSDLANELFSVYSDVASDVVSKIRAKAMKGGGIDVSAGVRLQREIDNTMNEFVIKWAAVAEPYFSKAFEIGEKSVLKFVDIGGQTNRDQVNEFFSTEISYLTSRRGLVGSLKARLNTLIGNAMKTRSRPENEVSAASSAAEISSAAEDVFAVEAHRVPVYAGAVVELSNRAMTEALEGSVEVDPTGEQRPIVWYAEWVAVGDNRTCPACTDLAMSGIRPKKEFRTEPGGDVFCGRRCRCILVLWTEAEVKGGNFEILNPENLI